MLVVALGAGFLAGVLAVFVLYETLLFKNDTLIVERTTGRISGRRLPDLVVVYDEGVKTVYRNQEQVDKNDRAA